MAIKPKTAKPTIVADRYLALDVTLVKLDTLIPYIRNPRQHSADQIIQLAASMREFGWTMPVICDEDQGILAGHGRVLAARKLGWDEAPVVWARGWSEAKRRAYVIADNKLALNASWDTQLLSAELDALAEDEFDMNILGFSEQDLARLADDLMGEQFNGASGSTDEKENSGGSIRTGNVQEHVSLVIPMSVMHREAIFQAIGRAKRDFNLDQSGEALWQICKRYLEPPQ